MMEQKPKKWPWITALIVCICIASFSVVFMVTRMQPAEQPQTPDYVGLQFEKLFSDPDWASLYALSEQQDTVFENADTVAAYMRVRVGDKQLTLFQMNQPMQDAQLFAVYCDDIKIATFSLYEADWSLRHINLILDRKVSVMVQALPDMTVFVNGVALDDSYVAYSMHTKAEAYLPEGVHGRRMTGYLVNNLLMEPEVTAADQFGNPVSLIRDEQTGVYRVQSVAPAEMTQAQRDFVIGAASADAMYAIGKISNAKLAEYVDENSQLYAMLTDNPRNLQKYTSSSIDDVSVGEFCRYSDHLFSANVKLTQNIIRKSGTLKVYYVDKTYFFKRCDNGEYRVVDYTNEHVTDQVETVRLTFITSSGEQCQMVDINASSVSVPDMSEYNGLIGWATQSENEEGDILMNVRVLPDGTVLGGLEPMVLHPLFPNE